MKNLSRRNFLGNIGTIGATAVIAPTLLASTPALSQSDGVFKSCSSGYAPKAGNS